MDIEKQVQRAASLIAHLREVDTDFRVFGAESHRYQIGPTLSEDELRAFEREHKIELSPDYRLYLKTVGNGNGRPPNPRRGILEAAGVGPNYGIYRLEDGSMGLRTSEPFPFEKEVEIEDELLSLWGRDIPGLLEIGSKGCAESTHLVVNGASYGTVWDADHHDRFWPTEFSFTEWICNWAECAIPCVLRERVTNSVKVGMKLKEVVSICGDNGKRPYFLTNSILRFEGLVTQFEFDQSGKVSRIIAHSI